jgi:hypothetical protein
VVGSQKERGGGREFRLKDPRMVFVVVCVVVVHCGLVCSGGGDYNPPSLLPMGNPAIKLFLSCCCCSRVVDPD